MNKLRETNQLPAGPAKMPAWVIDCAVVLAVLIVTFAPLPAAELHPNSALGYADAVAAAGVLPLRRRWPVLVLGALVVFYAANAYTGVLSLGNGLAIG